MIQNLVELTFKYSMQKQKESHLKINASLVGNADTGQKTVPSEDMINAATMTMDLREGLITEDHLAIMTLTWTDALLTQETMDILGMAVVMVTEAAVLQGLLQGFLEHMKVTPEIMEVAGIKRLEYPSR